MSLFNEETWTRSLTELADRAALNGGVFRFVPETMFPSDTGRLEKLKNLTVEIRDGIVSVKLSEYGDALKSLENSLASSGE